MRAPAKRLAPWLLALLAGCGGGSGGGAAPEILPPLGSAPELLREFETLVPHRRGGTPESLVAHDWVVRAFRRAGIADPRTEEFGFRNWQPTRTRLRVRGPGIDREVAHEPLWFAGPGRYAGPLAFARQGWRPDYGQTGAVGKAALVVGNPLLARTRVYAFAEQAGAAALVSIGAAPENLPQIYPVRDLGEPPGTIPALAIGGEDGDLLRAAIAAGPTQAEIEAEAEVSRGTGRNVVARVPGTVDPERQILFAAHRDAWFSGGADNGAGTATILKLAEHYKKNPARHTITLVSTDVEEWGLYGAAAYIQDHPEERERTLVAFSVDTAVSTADALGTVGHTVASPLRLDLLASGFTSLYTAPLPLQLIAAVQGGLLGNDAQPFFFWGVQTSMAVALPPRYHTREDLSEFMDLGRLETSIEKYIETTDLVDARGADAYLVEETMRMGVAPGPALDGEPVEVSIDLAAPGSGAPVSGAAVKCVVLHDDLIFRGAAPATQNAPGDYSCALPADFFFPSDIPFQIDVIARHSVWGVAERFVPVRVP